jgi:hypothetical protein
MNQPTDSIAPIMADVAEPRPAPEGGLSIDDCRLSIAGKKPRKGEKPKRPKRTAGSAQSEAKEGWKGRVQAHRQRQALVARILNRTFGRFAKSNPELWERRTYLMLVGLMYQWLATNDEEISTDELVALSKALAEQRRAEAQAGDGGGGQPRQAGGGDEGELPNNFAEIVRQVYGTNFQPTK